MMESVPQFINFLQSILVPKVDLTVLDIILLAVFLVYCFQGYAIGFAQALLDLASFALSFLFGLKGYSLFGHFLNKNFSLSLGLANAIGFFIVCAISEIVFAAIGKILLKQLGIAEGVLGKTNRILGIVPSLISCVILLSFLLTLVISLPVSPFLKHTISSSKIGSLLVISASSIEKNLNLVFGEAVRDTLNFLTVEPQSNETVLLHFSTTNVSDDTSAEQYMLKLVNKERTSRGLSQLAVDEKLTGVARAHGKDMFARGYFSHYTPDGLSPFDRMAKADISFQSAGENIAFSPNTDLSMQGLMRSPGHKANILSSDFHKVGIGVIDGGMYGEMFAQEFTD